MKKNNLQSKGRTKQDYYILSVKGQDYKLSFFDDERTYLGRTNTKTKEILIYARMSKKLTLQTIYHELLHALFFECGLQTYYSDETLITWLDTQSLFLMSVVDYFNKKVDGV